MKAVDPGGMFSLVVVGEAFGDKGKAARIRMTRELGNALHERLRVAVIQAEELQQQYLFGPRQLLTMLLCFGITALVVAGILTHQRALVELLTRKSTQWRLLSAAGVALFVPLFAYCYGKATHYLLKLIRME